MTKEFIPNKRYSELLIANSNFHVKVRAGKANYTSGEFRDMQRELTDIERVMPSEEIIQHAEYLFPKVGE